MPGSGHGAEMRENSDGMVDARRREREYERHEHEQREQERVE